MIYGCCVVVQLGVFSCYVVLWFRGSCVRVCMCVLLCLIVSVIVSVLFVVVSCGLASCCFLALMVSCVVVLSCFVVVVSVSVVLLFCRVVAVLFRRRCFCRVLGLLLLCCGVV